jgi:alkaline phosphatase D
MNYLQLLNRENHCPSRRRLLRQASIIATAVILPAGFGRQVNAQPRFPDFPFKLGVASGDPLSDGFVIWTRLAPYPLQTDYGMTPEPVLVNWQVADRENMSNVVAEGTTLALPEFGHSVHVELRGLQPGREYFYRFSVGDAVSRIGRGITAPVIGSPLDQFRVAFVSCQHYERGYFPAYRDLVQQNPDLVVHLGDYIYENDPNRFSVRRHEGPEPVTLEQYRARYSTYRMDADLQNAHAHTSWAFTWDDHEVDNNYAGAMSQDFDAAEAFLRRRAAAYQAYYEMMPLRASAKPRGPDMQIYQRLTFGDLLDINMMDDRQYRSEHPCDYDGGGVIVMPELCSQLYDPSRTMLGEQQHRWLEGSLSASTSRWNVLAQQTLFAEFNRGTNGQTLYSTDGWGGYPVSRDRIVRHLVEANVSNPVFLGGDVHAYWVTDIKEDWRNPDSRTVASEFVTTSITSSGGSMDAYRPLLAQNPHVKFIETEERGYTLCTVTPQQWLAEHRAMPDAGLRDPDTRLSTARRWVVENGRPGAQLA